MNTKNEVLVKRMTDKLNCLVMAVNQLNTIYSEGEVKRLACEIGGYALNDISMSYYYLSLNSTFRRHLDNDCKDTLQLTFVPDYAKCMPVVV